LSHASSDAAARLSARLDGLRRPPGERHHGSVEDPEATQLMLEALFDIRTAVHAIHDAIFGEDDGEEAEEEDA
jgi:hypothetical protein